MYPAVKFKPYCILADNVKLNTQVSPNFKANLKSQAAILTAKAVPAVKSFTGTQIAKMYNIPAPTANPVVVGVISFGGGLYGTLTNGVLSNGDVQNYWTSLGITSQPKVIIVPISGARNVPNFNDGGSTIENTLDVETIGACCPTSNLTIILYIAPNTLSNFYTIINYMINTPVVVSGISYVPNIISCSWGLSETKFSTSLLTSINTILTTASNRGINICTATGDLGSNDGVGGSSKNADFPSSCPFVTAVGGTTLTVPSPFTASTTYNTTGVIETAWSSGGGAVSVKFAKPAYQSAITGTSRSVPDIALVANPNTGVSFLIAGKTYTVGGTSVAAPIFAAFLAAIKANGFVNTKLYTQVGTTCFHDIVSGSNGGYTAGPGYDNCTGLGSINGGVLAPYLI